MHKASLDRIVPVDSKEKRKWGSDRAREPTATEAGPVAFSIEKKKEQTTHKDRESARSREKKNQKAMDGPKHLPSRWPSSFTARADEPDDIELASAILVSMGGRAGRRDARAPISESPAEADPPACDPSFSTRPRPVGGDHRTDTSHARCPPSGEKASRSMRPRTVVLAPAPPYNPNVGTVLFLHRRWSEAARRNKAGRR